MSDKPLGTCTFNKTPHLHHPFECVNWRESPQEEASPLDKLAQEEMADGTYFRVPEDWQGESPSSLADTVGSAKSDGPASSDLPAVALSAGEPRTCWECEEPAKCLSGEVCYGSHAGYPKPAEPSSPPATAAAPPTFKDLKREAWCLAALLRQFQPRTLDGICVFCGCKEHSERCDFLRIQKFFEVFNA